MPFLEKMLYRLVIGFVPPMFFMLGAWWTAYLSGLSPLIPWAVLAGLTLGLIVDAVFLERWIARLYDLPNWALFCLYGFYTLGMFGLFMGVPVFNLVLTVLAALYIAGRQRARPDWKGTVEGAARLASRFTTGVLALVFVVSAWIALNDPYTAGNLEGMLGLGFQLTRPMLVVLIVGGGLALLFFNWWLAGRLVHLSSPRESDSANARP